MVIVDPTLQGRGHGKKLMQVVMTALGDPGIVLLVKRHYPLEKFFDT